SPEAQAAGERWFHLDVPRHLTHVTPQSLDRLLRTTRIAPFRTSYYSPEHDYFSFVQTALNVIGVRFNLLYQLVRRHEARTLSGRRQRFTVASTIATLAL